MATSSGSASVAVAGVAFGVAAGVLLGTYALAPNLPGDSVGTLKSESSKKVDQLESQSKIAAAQADAADSVAQNVAEAVVQGTLTDTPVLVLRTHDAVGEDFDVINDLLEKAGASSAGSIKLDEKFFSPEGADKLKSIITNTLPAGAQLSEERMDPGYHAGEALAQALLRKPDSEEGRASDADRDALLEALKEAGYVDFDDGGFTPAAAVVILSGDSQDSEEGAVAAKNIAEFAEAMDGGEGATVLAGRYSAAAENGPVGIARDTAEIAETVTTVDSINRSYARMSVVLAVKQQLEGGSGAYGAAPNAEAAHPPSDGAPASGEVIDATDTAEDPADSGEQEAGAESEGENSDAGEGENAE
ncbi:Copper transporter MctB precursor [Corynebacterium ciconiae DSM 44920]|uniref:copper transporter n=1 Tax=Corynebacterium ciconiae TaxID=227319 RepID=UPI000368B64D|nr:copper transporter [Corynebacterium ciconiae]WKD61118.1 Copper transporter MctB precursor [Corynebacterium ciconiae DSM 44920]